MYAIRSYYAVSFDEKAALWDTDPVKNHRAQSVAKGIRAAVSLKPEMSGFEYGSYNFV